VIYYGVVAWPIERLSDLMGSYGFVVKKVPDVDTRKGRRNHVTDHDALVHRKTMVRFHDIAHSYRLTFESSMDLDRKV
jgi:hypothetical protein